MNIIDIDLNVSEPEFQWDADVADPQALALSHAVSIPDYESTPFLKLFYAEATPPALDNQDPAPSDTVVALDKVISFDLVDLQTGINAASVVLTVAGVVAWENEAAQNSFVVNATPIDFGYTFTITAPADFAEYTNVSVQVYAEDNGAPSILNTTYSFRTIDLTQPYLANQDPAPAETDVSAVKTLEVDVVDAGAGVAASTVIIQVAGNTVWTGDAQVAPYVVTKSVVTGGFRYEIEPNSYWTPESTILVAIEADDLAATPLSLSTSYSFQTAFLDVTEPTIPDGTKSPAPDAIDIPSEQAILFSIYDDIQVDLSAVRVYVRGELVFNGTSFETYWEDSSYAANANNGYDFVLRPDTLKSWRHFENVTVRVVAADTTDFFGGGP